MVAQADVGALLAVSCWQAEPDHDVASTAGERQGQLRGNAGQAQPAPVVSGAPRAAHCPPLDQAPDGGASPSSIFCGSSTIALMAGVTVP